MVSASFDKALKLWDGVRGTFVATLRGHVGPIYQVAWSADSRLLVSASKDSTLKARPAPALPRPRPRHPQVAGVTRSQGMLVPCAHPNPNQTCCPIPLHLFLYCGACSPDRLQGRAEGRSLRQAERTRQGMPAGCRAEAAGRPALSAFTATAPSARARLEDGDALDHLH